MASKLSSLTVVKRKKYYALPPNWNSGFKENFIYNQEDCKEYIKNNIDSEKLVVIIDTCSFINLSKLSDSTAICKTINSKYDFVIFTAEVIKELTYEELSPAGDILIDSNWNQREYDLIVALKSTGLKLLYIEEAEFAQLVYSTFASREMINTRCQNFIRHMLKISDSKIKIVSDKVPAFKARFIARIPPENIFLESVMTELKKHKSSGDSLAEQLLIILLNSWINDNMFKIHILSEDRNFDDMLAILMKFQDLLIDKGFLSEIKIMGRVELINLIKECIDNGDIKSDSDILGNCKTYRCPKTEKHKVTITGGVYLQAITVSLSDVEIIRYMKNPDIKFLATNNYHKCDYSKYEEVAKTIEEIPESIL